MESDAMRSSPWILIWEMLYLGRWSLIAAALGANVLPILLFSALRRTGALDPTDPSQFVMHIMLIQLNMFAFGAGVIAAQGNPSRLYTAPIRTSTLVAWHLLPAALLVGLQSVLSTLAL